MNGTPCVHSILLVTSPPFYLFSSALYLYVLRSRHRPLEQTFTAWTLVLAKIYECHLSDRRVREMAFSIIDAPPLISLSTLSPGRQAASTNPFCCFSVC